ncbi:M23 family metallopeptidase [Angelakisella massiliensis]|uniref:M23 family metallopeptidase n=1 Tax=Angelakisella massiliensis TaxID=1871018 RepID=UPI0023A89695|nr:M23 family metallopeptidase [Angelakisella massiliensis]
MQYLVMPFTRCMMLCGYKNPEYTKYWGYPHYGVDISTIQGGASDDHRILASGEGVVLAAGKDSRLGYGAAVLYNDAFNHQTGEVISVVGRYMHMKSLLVKEGDAVQAGTVIGEEGKEGTSDYHLHLEFDTDVTPTYATWSPQVAGTGGFWKKGVDSTVNPSHLLHMGPGQSLAEPTYNPAWLNPEDFVIPQLESTDDCAGQLAALQKELEQERRRREIAEEAQRAAESRLEEIKDKIKDLVAELEEKA